jgi:energy-coupling factor transport system ATP-binding protein
LGLIKAEGEVTINGLEMSQKNVKTIISKIGVVFENPDDQFVAETVMDDIAFSLENMQLEPKVIRKKVKKVAKYLDIEHILEREPHTLSGGEKQLVALTSALVINPDILILDEALTMLDIDDRNKIYSILKQINQDNGVTIINVTHDMDEVLFGKDIIILDEGNIIIKGPKELVLKEEKIFNKLGMALPFMAELSIKLSYYELLDRMIFDMDEMVEELWK